MIKKILLPTALVALCMSLGVKMFVDKSEQAYVKNVMKNAVAKKQKLSAFSKEFLEQYAVEYEGVNILHDPITIPTFTRGTNLTLSFAQGVRDTYIESNDFVDLSNSINGNNVTYRVLQNKTVGSMRAYAVLNDYSLVYKDVYSYKLNDVSYFSETSKDEAWYSAASTNYLNGDITEEEAVYDYEEFSRENMVESEISVVYPGEEEGGEPNGALPQLAPRRAASGNTSISGRITFTDANGRIHPLKNTHIMVYDEEILGIGILMGSTYTDSDGNYAFYFNNPDQWYHFENGGADPFIRVCSESNTFAVRSDWLFNYLTVYSACSSAAKNVKTGSNTTINLRIIYDSSINANKAFSVQQGMVAAQTFAHDYGGMPLNNSYNLNVAYPGYTGTSFSYTAFSAIDSGDWDDWYTVMHEYGHYVENIMGTYGANIIDFIVNDPSHYSDANHFEDKPQRKYAMQLTWSEAWAYAMAMICYTEYSAWMSNVSFASNIPTEISNCESRVASNKSGEAQEQSVEAFLWDLYDNSPSEDPVNLGATGFMSATLKKGICTFTDFVKSYNSSNRVNMYGAIAEKYHIAPGNVQIVDYNTDNPTVKWTPNGCDTYPNNKFDILFYGASGTLIKTISNINLTSGVGYNGTMQYTLSNSDWLYIYNNAYYDGLRKIQVAVRGYQTSGDPISGPFYSKATSAISLPNKTHHTTLSAGFRIFEDLCFLNPAYEYHLTFTQTADIIFQTLGNLDTIIDIYDLYGNLLRSNDSSGFSLNAFIRYQVTGGQTYRVVVRAYNSYSYGTARFLAIPSTGLSSNANAINCFDDIYSALGIYDQFYLPGVLDRYATKMFVFSSRPHANFKFEIFSSMDTYLFVIDCYSSEPLVRYQDFDDDSGENLNSRITRGVSSNTPYLVIISQYNNETNRNYNERMFFFSAQNV